MADPEHLDKLAEGVEAWNTWRRQQDLLFRPDLANAKFRGVDLHGIHLGSALLREVDLEGACLTAANLRGADLEGANLTFADLSQAELVGARLRSALLQACDLRRTTLFEANFEDADLREADFSEADMAEAHFVGADLRSIDLSGVTRWTPQGLRGANIHGVRHPPPGFVEEALASGAVDEPSRDAWLARKRRTASSGPRGSRRA